MKELTNEELYEKIMSEITPRLNYLDKKIEFLLVEDIQKKLEAENLPRWKRWIREVLSV